MGTRRIDYEEIHREILLVAEHLFRDNGIVYTEMKDIAQEIGVGRSTLYRHYSSKESILFELAETTVADILTALQVPPGQSFRNGMEEFEWMMRSLLKRVIEKKDKIVFLRDFDMYFSKGYPETEAAQSYEDFAKGLTDWSAGASAVKRGIGDGSIRDKGDASLIAATVIHSMLAIAQRVLPREDHFLKEAGLSEEFLYLNLEFLLDGLRA